MKLFAAIPALALSAVLAGAAYGAVIDEIVIKVNDSVVTKTEFDRRLESTAEGMKREYKGPDMEARLKEMPQKLLEQMVEELLLVERAKQLYQIDELVKYQVENFMKDNKVPTKEDLAKALEKEGMTMDEFRKQILQVYVPEFVKSREIRSKISLSTDEIQAFYDAHKNDFATQPQLNLQEIYLAKPGTTDEQAAQAGAEITRQFGEGKDFGELAAAFSQANSRSNKGDAGWFSASDLSPTLSKAVFATPVGKITPLLGTPSGFYIFRVADRREPKVPTLEEARDTIVNALREQKFQKEYKAYIDNLKAESYVRINPKYV
jgi:peptidyl-prolyl cis-trans isomerase SurA